LALLFSGTAFAESTSAPEPPELLLAARILDIRSGSYLTDDRQNEYVNLPSTIAISASSVAIATMA
jgi:hypothetical protein